MLPRPDMGTAATGGQQVARSDRKKRRIEAWEIRTDCGTMASHVSPSDGAWWSESRSEPPSGDACNRPDLVMDCRT